MEEILDRMWMILSVYGLKVLAAIAVLALGHWAARFCSRLARRVMERRKVDPTLVAFAGSLIFYALLAFVVLAALGQLGIQTTSFVALVGAAGLAIGLALQGSLANFAAGFLLILFRPFRAGDYIEGAGTAGTVEGIQIFTTQLTTPDNKRIIIPNAKLTGDNIVNWSASGTRRVDLEFGVGYGADIDRAKAIIAGILAEDGRVLQDPAPAIAVAALADSSVKLVARPWASTADYWGVVFDTTEKVKKRFDAEGIPIPYPQRDVHLYQHAGG